MERPKLVIPIYKSSARSGRQNMIRLTDEAMEAIEKFQQLTGTPTIHLASRLILFAADYVEIER